MQKFIKASGLMVTALAELGLRVGGNNWIQVCPKEEEMTAATGMYRDSIFHREASSIYEKALLDAGFVVDFKFNDRDYTTLVYECESSPFRVNMRVEADHGDECVKLKARLAELGCHY
jgi:hypothetical protein